MARQVKDLWGEWLTDINQYLKPSQQSHIWPGTFVILNAKSGEAEISKFNVGNRPLTIDTYPLIGQTSIEGLWLLTGT